MKTDYSETILLLLLVYFGWKNRLATARHSHHTRRPLLDCTRCPPGFGAERPCTRHRDTQCAPCPPHHYSAHHSARRPCFPCSLCGTGLYVAHRCTATRDTVCDSCHTYRGPHNEDYHERCVKPVQNGTAATTLRHEADHSVRMDRTRGMPSSVLVMSGIAVAVLAMALLVTFILSSTRWRCKRADCRYPYQAVSTNEVVML